MTVAKCSWQVACEFVSGQVPTLWLDSGTVSPLRLCWVKDVCVFRCNLPPALLAEWPGSFTCHCSNMGVEWTLNKSQHTKLSLKKKILLLLLSGFKLTTLQLWVQCFFQQAILAPEESSLTQSGLDSSLLSPLLFFCRVLLLFLSYQKLETVTSFK